MKKTKYLLAAGVVLIAAGIWFLRSQQVGDDLAVLQNENANPHEIYRSLLRLGKTQSTDAKEFALKNLQNKNPVVRAGAYEALGAYDDASVLKVLSEGLLDADKIVRLATVRGFARNPTAERLNLCLERLKSKDLTTQDQIELYATVARMGQKAEVDLAVTELIKIAQNEKGPEATDATFRVASFAGQDPRVTQLYKNKLKEGEPRMMALAIRHLSAMGDKDVLQSLKKYSQHEKADVRVAAIQAAALACASDRWDIVRAILKTEKNDQVLRSLLQASVLRPDAQSELFLKEQIASGTLATDLIDLAKKSLVQLQKNPKKNSCEGR